VAKYPISFVLAGMGIASMQGLAAALTSEHVMVRSTATNRWPLVLGLPLGVDVVAAGQRRALAVHGQNAEAQPFGLEGFSPMGGSDLGVEGTTKLVGGHRAEQVAFGRVGDAPRDPELTAQCRAHLRRHLLELGQTLGAGADGDDDGSEQDAELPAAPARRSRIGEVIQPRLGQPGGEHAGQSPIPPIQFFHRFPLQA
jgi:hypothetical protein